MRSGVRLRRGYSLLLFCHFVLAGFISGSLCAQTLRIYHIDVEQGDATLLVAPSGKTLLVDSGKNGHGDRLKAVLDEAGVTRIDFFVNTHYHEDHYGGIDDLVALGVPVGKTFDRGDKRHLPERKTQTSAFRGYQSSVGSRARRLRRGMTIALDPEMTVICTSSGGVVIGEENPVPGVSEQDMSLSLLVTFGDFHYFIGGDIERPTESKIASRDLVLDVDVYRANSHGSDRSSSPAFLEQLNPSVVIISNGNSARRQHPRGETLRRYEALSVPPSVFQTNKYLSGGDGANVQDVFIADVESSDSDGTILVTVNADSRDYRVSFAPDGSYNSYSFALRRGQVPEALPEVLVESQPLPVAMETSRMPDTPSEEPVESQPRPVDRVTAGQPGPFAVYVGLFVMVCAVLGTAGYFRITSGRKRKSELRTKPPSLVAGPVADADLAAPGVTDAASENRGTFQPGDVPSKPPLPRERFPDPEIPEQLRVTDPASENRGTLQPRDVPYRPRLRWERFPDSEIPEQLREDDRHTWVRRQSGRLTSRQGYVNVEFAEEIDFLTNVPVRIEHELCLSVVARPARESELQELGEETLRVYNKGMALLTALGNCSDADKAFLLKAETDGWLDETDSAIAAWFSSGTASLVGDVEGSNLKQRTERILGQLLRLIEGHPRVRNTQDTAINLKAGGSLGPGAEAFRDSLTQFELEQLVDVGALEELGPCSGFRQGL